MDIHVDARGKYFTPRITKDPILAYVRTTEHVVVGNIYVRPEQRIKDELNNDHGRFMPITEASVYDVEGRTLLFTTSLLLVGYDYIVAISPVEAVSDAPNAEWFTSQRQEEENA